MTWRDSLQPASWRGVPFHVEAADDEGVGRRVQVHEYPQRDQPYVEDLGRATERFSISAFLVGDDYLEQLERLKEALRKPGPGTLVHPWYGELQVVATDGGRVAHSLREGRMCRVDMAFVEAGELSFPTSARDTSAATLQAADDAQAAALDGFSETFSVAGLPDFVSAGALEDLEAVADVVDSIANFDLAERLRALVPADLARAYSIGERIWNTVAGVGRSSAGRVTAGSYRADAMQRLHKLASYAPEASPLPTATPARRQQAANREAVTRLVRRAALTEQARAAAVADWPVYDDAVEVRGRLSAALDAEAAEAEQDTVFRSLYGLRLATVQDMTARAARAPRLREVAPLVTTPAEVLAYELYEDAGRGSEVVARNGVRHPAFLPAAPLKVLSE